MNFYVITNGYMGNSYAKVYVVALTDEKALELARDTFKAEYENNRNVGGNYNEKYYENISIVHKFTSDLPYASEIED